MGFSPGDIPYFQEDNFTEKMHVILDVLIFVPLHKEGHDFCAT